MTTAKQWLLKQRLQNYGYDYKDFQKMSASKTRLKKKIKSMSDADIRRNLAKSGVLGKGRRLTKRRGSWDYTVGQSFNEELLNMLQLGSGAKRNWWSTQKIW